MEETENWTMQKIKMSNIYDNIGFQVPDKGKYSDYGNNSSINIFQTLSTKVFFIMLGRIR